MLTITGTSKAFRVDHNKFVSTTGLVTGIHVTGATYGVIDHNTLANTPITLEDDGDGSWMRPLNLGGADAVYLEDNTFDFNLAASTLAAHNGARVVFRYNTTNVGVGTASPCASGTRGTRKVEIYSNTLAATGAGGYVPSLPFGVRSGTGVIFNNFVTGLFSTPAIVVDDERSDATACTGLWAVQPRCDGTGLYDGNSAGLSGYLCRDQIGASTDAGLTTPQSTDPLYAWSNTSTLSSNPVNIVPGGGPGTALHVRANRDFFDAPRPDYVSYAYPHRLVGAQVNSKEASANGAAVSGTSIVVPDNVGNR